VTGVVYQHAVIEEQDQKAALECLSCNAAKEAAVANWEDVQSKVDLLLAPGKPREALKFKHEHEGERPLNQDIPCSARDFSPPEYWIPSAIGVLGLIISLTLFGVAQRFVRAS
jgi:hypothetical protein